MPPSRGVMQALAAVAADQLQHGGSADAPLQTQWLRRMMTACETVRLWLEHAATGRILATPALRRRWLP